MSSGPSAAAATPRATVIDLDGVSRTYEGPPPLAALRSCNLQVATGQLLTIVGPSGSGKSTLLNMLGLLDRPSAGEYRLNGVDTSNLSEAERSGIRGGWIGFVFQSFHLLPDRTATENVALAMLYSGVPHKARLERAREVLARVGLAPRAEALPTQMSGGERQRVAIARALAHRPALLLCDEPTGNLDQRTATAVLDLISEIHNDGQTVLIITHDASVAARGERTLTIRDGVLTEQRSDLI